MLDFFTPTQTTLRAIKPNKHLEISISIIYYMGMWPSRTKYRCIYFFYTIFSFIFMLGILLISEFANIVIHWGDMKKVMAGASLLITNFNHAYKVFFILRYHTLIRKLIDVTESKLFNRDNVKYEHIVTHYTWSGIFHHIAYQTFGLLAVTLWGVSPIVVILSTKSRVLPIEGWYPYNVTDTPFFEITALYQYSSVLVCCVNNVAIDTVATGLITIACCQLTLLSHNISSISVNSDTQLISPRDNAAYNMPIVDFDKQSHKHLEVCIRHSNMIYDFSKKIENIFGTVIFFQFLANCIIICLIAYNITQMTNYIPSVLLGMLMYMCCMTYQIFIYCWHGNELHLHSMNMILAAYSNNWWYATKSFNRGLLILMTRAQKPLMLSAGNIMNLSLETFVKILRTSYSIFTVLQSSTDN